MGTWVYEMGSWIWEVEVDADFKKEGLEKIKELCENITKKENNEPRIEPEN